MLRAAAEQGCEGRGRTFSVLPLPRGRGELSRTSLWALQYSPLEWPLMLKEASVLQPSTLQCGCTMSTIPGSLCLHAVLALPFSWQVEAGTDFTALHGAHPHHPRSVDSLRLTRILK